MTQEQQDKLRKALYNAGFTIDAYDKNPFIGAFFNDLLDVLQDFEEEIYRDGWLAGEANLAKEYKCIPWIKWVPVDKELPKEKGAYLFHFDDGQTRVEGYFPDIHLSKSVTHWAEIVPPEEED